VDNAFDAGATHVAVSITEDKVMFTDDGVGITKEKISAVFSLGEHGPMTTTQLGRFGVGLKSQAANAGDELVVISKSKDGRVRASVNWRDVLRDGQWKIDDPRWLLSAVDEPTGTTIAIGQLRRRPKLTMASVAEDLSQRFYPAIAEGKTITFNGPPVHPLREPVMTDIIDREISLSGGRSAHLRAGILCEPSKLNRVHVAFKHRVIMPSSTLGCGDYGGLNKMFARLQISGPWHLAKFKDDLTDEAERDELDDLVLNALTPILEKCSSASLSAKLDRHAHLINEQLPPEIAPSRRPHSKKEKDKSVPSKSGRTGFVAPDKSEPEGPAKSKRSRDEVLITFDGVAESDGIGAFQKGGKTHRVDLSKDDPFVAELIEHRDEEFGNRCLLAIALAIFEHGREAANPEPDLPFDGSGRRIAKHLSFQNRSAAIGRANK
jgi:hypothetical protein